MSKAPSKRQQIDQRDLVAVLDVIITRMESIEESYINDLSLDEEWIFGQLNANIDSLLAVRNRASRGFYDPKPEPKPKTPTGPAIHRSTSAEALGVQGGALYGQGASPRVSDEYGQAEAQPVGLGVYRGT